MKKIITMLFLSLLVFSSVFAIDWVRYGIFENEEVGTCVVYFDYDATEPFELENERYFSLYGVHKEDLNNYDFVLDTTKLTPEEVNSKIIEAYKIWLEN